MTRHGIVVVRAEGMPQSNSHAAIADERAARTPIPMRSQRRHRLNHASVIANGTNAQAVASDNAATTPVLPSAGCAPCPATKAVIAWCRQTDTSANATLTATVNTALPCMWPTGEWPRARATPSRICSMTGSTKKARTRPISTAPRASVQPIWPAAATAPCQMNSGAAALMAIQSEQANAAREACTAAPIARLRGR